MKIRNLLIAGHCIIEIPELLNFHRIGLQICHNIELLDKPTIVWEFHSLLLGIQMMFSFMLTDDNSTLKVCKHCGSAFVATRSNMEFCSPQCKNQYNVYKSRAKKKED